MHVPKSLSVSRQVIKPDRRSSDSVASFNTFLLSLAKEVFKATVLTCLLHFQQTFDQNLIKSLIFFCVWPRIPDLGYNKMEKILRFLSLFIYFAPCCLQVYLHKYFFVFCLFVCLLLVYYELFFQENIKQVWLRIGKLSSILYTIPPAPNSNPSYIMV